MEATWPTLVGKMHKCRAGLVMLSRPPLVMGSNENSYLSYRFTGGLGRARKLLSWCRESRDILLNYKLYLHDE